MCHKHKKLYLCKCIPNLAITYINMTMSDTVISILCYLAVMLFLTAHSFCNPVSVVASPINESYYITGAVEFNVKEHYIMINDDQRPDEEDLIQRMPKEISVYLNNENTPVSIPVTWFSITDDYDNRNKYYYQFSPSWNVDQYQLSPEIDLFSEMPYIGVFVRSGDGDSVYAASVTGKSQETEVYNFLRNDLFLNIAECSGVLANIQCESSFNEHTKCVDTNGLTSYGLIQWNGTRYTSLMNWCSDNGYDYTTVNGQMHYLKHEMETSEAYYWGKVKGKENTSEGAYWVGYDWARYFERCAEYYKGRAQWVERANLARDNYWPEYKEDSKDYTPGVYRVSTSSGSNLMLRDGPDTDGTNILERIPNSTELTVTEINGRWGKTTYNEKTGWIALWYCERIGDIQTQHYVFDLNGLLDGDICGDLGAYGTADVYINGTLVADDQNDYYNTNVPAGSYYEVTDVHWNSDVYDSKGLASGNWTGTVDGDVDVRLSFTTRSSLSVSAGTSVRATRFSWTPVKNTEYYHVKIWNGEHWAGDAFHIEWNLTGTSCEIALPAGYYEAYVDSQFSDTVTMSNVVPFTVIAEGTGMTTGGERVIPDGDYLIAATGYSDKSSYFYLDIEGAACPAANAANVLLTGPAQNLSEFDIWTLTYKDGFYTIAQKGTDMCLDVKDASTLEGGNVWVWEANESSAQKWVISLNGSDGYRVQSKCSGLSLDYCGGECINNTNIQQWRNNSSAAQSWMFIPYKPEQTLADGRYVLLSSVDSVFEVDIPGETGDIENLTNVQIWNSGNSSSRFNSFDVKKLENGYYTLTHVASGKEVSSLGGTSSYGQNIGLYDPNGHPAHEWAITRDGDNGGYVLRTRCGGMAMDLVNGNAVNGTNIQQLPYNGTKAQTWIFVPAEYTISYDTNGGEGAPESQVKYYRSDLKLNSAEPSRIGYEFIGWGKTKNASRADYEPGDTYKEEADIRLYALWKTLKPDLVLPTSLKRIDEEAFACGIFSYVILPDGLEEIKSRAFAGCNNLRYIVIPESVTFIASDAFEGTDELIIMGEDGSYAEFYANKKGFGFAVS